MAEDEPEQAALFEIEGSDEDGCVSVCSPKGDPHVWCQNLGPEDKVTEKWSQWLAERDYGDRS